MSPLKNQLPAIRKGMILCAGLGTRLLPITEKFPKPVVPVLNIPNVLHNLYLLRSVGVTEIVINLHHLAGFIKRLLGDGSRWGVRISYSHEEKLLGTGGGLKKAENFFEGERLILANCDFVTNLDLAPILARHAARKATATMVLFEDAQRQALYSKVGIDKNSNLCVLSKTQVGPASRTGIFSGIHILENEIFRYLQEIPSGINEVLYPALMREHPATVFGDFMQTGEYWYDTGDLPALWSTSMTLLAELQSGGMLSRCLRDFEEYEERETGIWIPKGEVLPDDVKLRAPVILGRECAFGSAVELGPFAIVGDRASLGEASSFSHSLVLGEAETLAQQKYQETIIFENGTLSPKKNDDKK